MSQFNLHVSHLGSEDREPWDWITWLLQPLMCNSVITLILSEKGLYPSPQRSKNCARALNILRAVGYYIVKLFCLTNKRDWGNWPYF